MKARTGLIVWGIAGILASLLGGCTAKAAASPPGPAAPAVVDPGYRQASAVGVTFEWKVDGGSLDCVLRSATTGWVGVGFGTSGQMKGSEIIIGYVANGQAEVVDSFGDQLNHHAAVTDLGGESIVSNASGTQENGATELHFSVQLNATGKFHVPLVPGQDYILLLAHGPSGADDDVTYHGPGNRGTVKITL